MSYCLISGLMSDIIVTSQCTRKNSVHINHYKVIHFTLSGTLHFNIYWLQTINQMIWYMAIGQVVCMITIKKIILCTIGKTS